MLDGDVIVLERAPLAVGGLQQLHEVRREPGLGAAEHLGLVGEAGVEAAAQLRGGDPELVEQRVDDAFALAEEHREEVFGLDVLVVARRGEIAGAEHRLLGFLGELVDVHAGRVFTSDGTT